MRKEAEDLRASGKLKLSGMSHGKEFWNDSKVRIILILITKYKRSYYKK